MGCIGGGKRKKKVGFVFFFLLREKRRGGAGSQSDRWSVQRGGGGAVNSFTEKKGMVASLLLESVKNGKDAEWGKSVEKTLLLAGNSPASARGDTTWGKGRGEALSYSLNY